MVHVPFEQLGKIPFKKVEEHTLHHDGREYVVCLHEGVDYDLFWTEIESATIGLTHIPDRPVRVANELPVFQRICHYFLTEDEVEILKKDPRVRSVSPPFETIPGLIRSVTNSQTANFNKPFVSTGDYKNWGLLRTNYSTNPYNLTTNTLNYASKYDYTLDGSNVDVVIMDTGIEPDHPEFTDANGVSRIKKITWFKEAGMSEFVDLNSSIKWNSIDPGQFDGPRVGNDASMYFITPLAYDSASFNNFQAPGSINWPGSIKLGIPIKTVYNALDKIGYPSVIGISHGAKDSNHSYVVRCKWQTSWGLINNAGAEVDWQIKFCDSNHMEITMIRHDYVTSRFKDYTTGGAVGGTPEFGMTTFAGTTVDFTSAFINQSRLVGASSQPVSIVLGTTDNGTTWSVYQGSKMVYANNAWQIQSGVATIIDPTTLANIDNTNNGIYFGTPFSFKIGPALRKYFYSDYGGHGTHCAGISVGKTFGWGKNANIYLMKLNDLTDFNNPDWRHGFTEYMGWGLIKKFHENKPINPATGVKNPTIVNMSFGTSLQFVDINYLSGGTYRGQNWTPSVAPQTDLPPRGVPGWKFYPAGTYNVGGQPYTFKKGFWYSVSCNFDASDVGLSELIGSGVICCIAAGNNGMRADSSTGADYNNSILINNFGVDYSYHYNRGCSPQTDMGIMVGAIDFVYPNNVTDQNHARASNNLNNLDQVAYFSNSGSLVTIYSPGVNITSSTSNFNTLGGVPYNENNLYMQTCISGTSMATPQVVGLLSLYMQANPTKTPAQAKQWLIDNSKATLFSTGLDNDYSTLWSLKGGPNRQMFNPLISMIPILDPPTVTDIGSAAIPVYLNKNSTDNLLPLGINGAVTSLSITQLAGHGTTNISGLILTYTPATNYIGTDTFKFTASNSGGTSNVGTAYIKVMDNNATPGTSPVTVTVLAKSTNNYINPVVSTNYDSIAVVGVARRGVVFSSGTQLVYTPRSTTLATTDSFGYTVTNSAGTSNISPVTVNILQGAYPTPVARAINITVPMNVMSIITTDTDNATDIRVGNGQQPNTTITYTIVSISDVTYYDIKAGLTINYTPPAGFTGTDQIPYTAFQARGDGTTSSSTSVIIYITVADVKTNTGLSISNGVVMTNGINLRLI